MRIEFVEKNYDIGTKLKNLFEKKLGKLDRYFDDDAKARVVCSFQNKIYKLELTITNKNKLFRAEVIGENMYENIDFALPKIERQIVKASSKSKSKVFKNVSTTELEFIDEIPAEKPLKVVRSKRFELEPLTLDDAENNLEALGHSFYVFLNAKSGCVNVLYKRNDGDLGLIEVDF